MQLGSSERLQPITNSVFSWVTLSIVQYGPSPAERKQLFGVRDWAMLQRVVWDGPESRRGVRHRLCEMVHWLLISVHCRDDFNYAFPFTLVQAPATASFPDLLLELSVVAKQFISVLSCLATANSVAETFDPVQHLAPLSGPWSAR